MPNLEPIEKQMPELDRRRLDVTLIVDEGVWRAWLGPVGLLLSLERALCWWNGGRGWSVSRMLSACSPSPVGGGGGKLGRGEGVLSEDRKPGKDVPFPPQVYKRNPGATTL